MGHHVRSLLLAVVLGAAAMAANGEDGVPPTPDFHMDFPPLPSPADMVPPPCLDSLSTVCQGVITKDSPMLAPCCTAVKKLFKSDPTCVCDAVDRTKKIAKQYNLTGSMYDGLETFRICDMPTTSCEPGKPGSQNIGNAAPNERSFGAFQIVLLLPLFFMLLL